MIGPSSDLVRFLLAAVLVSPAAVVLPGTLPIVVVAYVALIAVAVADAVRLHGQPRLLLRRCVPERTYVGRPAAVEIVVGNRGSDTARVEIVDEVAAALRTSDPSFTDLVLEAGAEQTVTYEVRPALRGDHPMGTLIALRRSSWGLVERRESLPPTFVRTYPDAARWVREQARPWPRRLGGAGAAPTPRRGLGSELDGLRDYVPGDDTRRIVWGPSARRGRPVVRVDRHERNHTVWIVLDTSRSMGAWMENATKLDRAIDAALALATHALGLQDRVGLVAFDSSVHTVLAPVRRRSEIAAFVAATQPLRARLVEPSFRTLARTMAARAGQRSLLVVVSDFEAADEGSLAPSMELLVRRHQVVFAGFRDPAFAALDVRRPRADGYGLQPYRRIVLADLASVRERAILRLRRAGVDAIDVLPGQLQAGLLNRYLTIRYGPER